MPPDFCAIAACAPRVTAASETTAVNSFSFGFMSPCLLNSGFIRYSRTFIVNRWNYAQLSRACQVTPN